MQSASNLSVDVEVKTGKAKADLDALNAKIRQTKKEIQDLTKAGDVAGTITKANTAATQQSTRAVFEHAVAMREASKYTLEFAKASGVALFGAKELRLGLAGLVAAETLKTLNDAIGKINDLSRAAKQIGTSPAALQTWEKLVVDSGGTAEQAAGSARRLGDLFEESGQKALEAGKSLGQSIQIIRGNVRDTTSEITHFGSVTTDVLLGTKPQLVSFADVLKDILHIERATYGAGAAEFNRFWVDVAKGIVALNNAGKTTLANSVTFKAFGQNFRELGRSLEAVAKSGNIEALGKQLGVKFITPEEIRAADLYAAALKDLSDAFFTLQRAIVIEFGPSITAAMQSLTETFKSTEFQKELNDVLKEIKQFIDDTIDEFNRLKRIAETVIDIAKRAASSKITPEGGEFTGEGIGGASSAAPAGQGIVPEGGEFTGRAAGGYIRGPGSGTSDSIAARLSNGEFVINAGSVRRLGVGFLHGLNNFALGGLVGAPPIRFAAGGLVSAASSSGRPVHLHLGSQSFALAGSSGVVDALVSHAHSQQIRSAGVKPSWFAGRPSGR